MAESNKESKRKLVSRREFLVASGAVIGASVLSACSPKTGISESTTTAAPTPTTTPLCNLAERAPCWLPIYEYTQQIITVKVGESFYLGLPTLHECLEEWAIESYDENYLVVNTDGLYLDADPAAPGQGGTTYFGFTAVKAGKTEIEMLYLENLNILLSVEKYSVEIN